MSFVESDWLKWLQVSSTFTEYYMQWSVSTASKYHPAAPTYCMCNLLKRISCRSRQPKAREHIDIPHLYGSWQLHSNTLSEELDTRHYNGEAVTKLLWSREVPIMTSSGHIHKHLAAHTQHLYTGVQVLVLSLIHINTHTQSCFYPLQRTLYWLTFISWCVNLTLPHPPHFGATPQHPRTWPWQ